MKENSVFERLFNHSNKAKDNRNTLNMASNNVSTNGFTKPFSNSVSLNNKKLKENTANLGPPKPKWNYSYRKPLFGTFDNQPSQNPPKPVTKNQTTVKKKIFKEDFSLNRSPQVVFKRPKRQTKNYQELNYWKKRTNELIKFNCFNENELRMGKEYVQKVIPQCADNDVSTDEEQIVKATRSIYIAIRVALDD